MSYQRPSGMDDIINRHISRQRQRFLRYVGQAQQAEERGDRDDERAALWAAVQAAGAILSPLADDPPTGELPPEEY